MRQLILLCFLLVITSRVHSQTDTHTSYIPPQVMQLGRGTAVALDWHPEGQVLSVGGSLGVWLYNDVLADLARFSEAGSVVWLAWSPDGNQLATADPNNTINLWDVNLSSYTFTLNRSWAFGEGSNALRFSWSPEGQRLAIITAAGAQVLDVRTGETLVTIPDLEFTLAWNPDGTRIAGVVDLGDEIGRQVRVWEASSGSVIHSYLSEDPSLFWSEVHWSPDGSLLVGMTSIPGTIYVWNAVTGDLLNDVDTITGEFVAYFDMWWLDNGEQLATVSSYVSSSPVSVLDVWETESWTSLNRGMSLVAVRSLAKHPNDAVWAVLTWDSQIMMWGLDQTEPLHVRAVHSQPFSLLTWSSDNQYLAAANRSGESVSIWDMTIPDQPKLRTATIPYLGWSVDQLRWGTNDDRLQGFLSIPQITAPGAFPTAFIVEWDAQTGEFLGSIHETQGYVAHDGSGYYLPRYVWSNDLSRVITQIADVPLIVSTVSDENGFLLPDQEITAVDVVDDPFDVVWSPDNSLIAVVSRDPQGENSAWVYHAETGDLISQLEPSNLTELFDISWSPDSSLVALAGRRSAGSVQTEYRLDIFEAVPSSDESAHRIIVFDTSTRFAHAWSPDSHAIAVGTSRGIGIYPVESAPMAVDADPITTVPDTHVFALAWSPDGRWLASSGEDGTVRIWDVTNINR